MLYAAKFNCDTNVEQSEDSKVEPSRIKLQQMPTHLQVFWFPLFTWLLAVLEKVVWEAEEDRHFIARSSNRLTLDGWRDRKYMNYDVLVQSRRDWVKEKDRMPNSVYLQEDGNRLTSSSLLIFLYFKPLFWDGWSIRSKLSLIPLKTLLNP